MNKLFIEIYNDIVRAHIVNTSNYSVLMSNEYPLSEDWATKVYADTQRVDNSIDNYSILFNQGTTKLYTKELQHRAVSLDEKGLKDIKRQINQTLFDKYQNFRTSSLKLSYTQEQVGLYNIKFIYEMVNQDQLNAINLMLLDAGFKTEGSIVESSLKNVTRVLNEYSNEIVLNIHIEDEFMRIIAIKNNRVVLANKTKYGLENTINEIARKMNISKEKAKEFFKNFGNIPPEAVIDNKVIHSYEDKDGNLHVFTKRDLSEYVTNYVDKLITSIRPGIKPYLQLETKVIFSGDVVTLRGFEDYLKKALRLFDTEVYESKTFGFVSVNTISMDGVIEKMKQNNEHQLQEQTKEKFIFKKLIKERLGKREV